MATRYRSGAVGVSLRPGTALTKARLVREQSLLVVPVLLLLLLIQVQALAVAARAAGQSSHHHHHQPSQVQSEQQPQRYQGVHEPLHPDRYLCSSTRSVTTQTRC
jgi:hypothetical protein